MELNNRIALAKTALMGTSIGDAFGDSFFGTEDLINECIAHRQIPPTKWEFTDDTIMTLAVFEELEMDGQINQDRLIHKFCTNHDKDINRGYGATVRRVLREISEGGDWKTIASNAFDGQGSMGNGAAMRVCPIGAYYFDDFKKVKELAISSATVTHTNNEAIAGAVAIAIATSITTKLRIENFMISPLKFIETVLAEVPDSDTHAKIKKSITLPYTYHIETVRQILGNGSQMTAQDTVPFVIWCVAHNLTSFVDALWKAVSIKGDRDTICAMVGGITTMYAPNKIPKEWLLSVENFEKSIFRSSK